MGIFRRMGTWTGCRRRRKEGLERRGKEIKRECWRMKGGRIGRWVGGGRYTRAGDSDYECGECR